MDALICSCGVLTPHIVARSYTFDGVRVELWNDGSITGRMGSYPPGLRASRRPFGLEEGRLAWADVPLYEWRELAALVHRARQRVARQHAQRDGARRHHG